MSEIDDGHIPRRPSFSDLRFDLKAACLEFLGTVFFLLIGFGGIQVANTQGSGLESTAYIAASMGLSLLTSAWMFYRVTGGLFNPSVSLAIFLIGGIGPVQLVMYIIAQLAGGITAAALIDALTPGPLLVNTYLQHGTNKAQGVFIEMFVTTLLVMAVLMLAAEKHEVTPFAPIGIGLALLVGHLFAVYYTGASMNTARAFGPAVVTGFPHNNHWIYWLGPFLGSLLGVAIYACLKHFRYWTINPNQTSVEPKLSPANPVDTIKATVNNLKGEGSVSERGRTSFETRDGGPSAGIDDNAGRRQNYTAV
jgi:aquaporin related protein